MLWLLLQSADERDRMGIGTARHHDDRTRRDGDIRACRDQSPAQVRVPPMSALSDAKHSAVATWKRTAKVLLCARGFGVCSCSSGRYLGPCSCNCIILFPYVTCPPFHRAAVDTGPEHYCSSNRMFDHSTHLRACFAHSHDKRYALRRLCTGSPSGIEY